jgi:hypothetical protein
MAKAHISDMDIIPAMDYRNLFELLFSPIKTDGEFRPAGYPNGWQAGFFLLK